MIREWGRKTYLADERLLRLRRGRACYIYGSGQPRVEVEAPDEELERLEREYGLVEVREDDGKARSA